MSAQSIGALVDLGIQGLAGVYFCLLGWNKVRVSKNPESDAVWKTKYGKLFRFLGPGLIAITLIQLFFRLH